MHVAYVLFTYFENQAATLSALRDRLLSNWQIQSKEIEKRAVSEDIPPLVEELLDYLITFAQEKPMRYRMGRVIPDKGSESLRVVQTKKLIAVDSLANLLRIGMKRGDFVKRDPLLAATTALGMVNVPFILFHTGRIDDPAFRDQMVDVVLSAAMQYLKNSIGNASMT